MGRQYDVVIIGAGPAGIFAALELSRYSLSVALFEQGPPLEQRRCPVLDPPRPCIRCNPCAITSGFGGAGAFSDGKLTLSREIGGNLKELIPEAEFHRLLEEVDEIYRAHGAPDRLYGTDTEAIEHIRYEAQRRHLILVPARLRHMGTDGGYRVLQSFARALETQGVEMHFRERVEEILVDTEGARGIQTRKGTYEARFVVAAPGRGGADWMARQARRLRIPMQPNPVDLGVRVEIPAIHMEPLTRVLYEPKLVYYSRQFEDRVRTFCVNPYGVVVQEKVDDVISVNGFSYTHRATDNTNFALLVSTRFTAPFNDPIAYGKSIARLANLLSGHILVQRLGDLRKGRRSTEGRIAANPVQPSLSSATPGDLSFVLPYRYLSDIVEMIEALEGLIPGINSPYTLLYGAEVKFYSNRLQVGEGFETPVPRLYAMGDGAGITRGLIQSSMSGLVVARHILQRLGAGPQG